jgi:hypothetical protein
LSCPGPTRRAAHLELLEGEPPAKAGLEVVALGHGADDGTERSRDWAREDRLGLLLTSDATALLAPRLVEPGPHAAGPGDTVPILLEVLIGDFVVMSRHLGVCYTTQTQARAV